MTQRPHFRVIAHRGDSAHAPGNSAEAFQRAIDAGVTHIETDVRLTADGILILEHDEDIGGLFVADATLAELRAVNPALQTVAGALHAFGSQVAFCWEVKVPRVVPALVTLIKDLTPDPLWKQTEFTSFIWANVAALRAFSPGSTVGWLTGEWREHAITRVAQAGLQQICPPAARVIQTPALVRVAHTHGLAVRVWSVSDLTLVRPLAEIGVDGGTVDFPAEALTALGLATKGPVR
jgi:glycerophosphoryl diester phosphodiesterase